MRFKTISILLLSIFFSGCTKPASEYYPKNQSIATNPLETYISTNCNYNPSYIDANQINEKILYFFPESSLVADYIKTNSLHLGCEYHFFIRQKPNQKSDYSIFIPTIKKFDKSISENLGNYHVQTIGNYLSFSTTYDLPEPITPPTDSFLNIYNLNLPEFQPTTITGLNISQLLHHLPIHLIWQDNNIYINSKTLFKSSDSENTNFVFQYSKQNPIDKNAISKIIDQKLNISYLSLENFSPEIINFITIDYLENLRFNYYDPNTANQVFSEITSSLKIESPYSLQTVTLPDDTTSKLFLPDPASKLEVTTFENGISYSNQQSETITIWLENQDILFSNEKDSANEPINIIPISSLIELFPSTKNLFQSYQTIQYQIVGDQISGYVNFHNEY